MTDKVALIKAEIEKRAKRYGDSSDVAWGKKCAYLDMLSFIDSLPEEPVSEDLEEDYKKYINKVHDELANTQGMCWEFDWDDVEMAIADAFKAGARWQKQQTIEESTVLYKRSFDFYGMEKNSGFLMEECGELMSAVNKLQRNRTNKEAVIEELADVYQVLMAFVMHFGYDKFSLMLDQKKKRLEERLH